jgi:uncharacterized Rmd1/YagE family protein
MEKILLNEQAILQVRALLIAQSLNLKALKNIECLATKPLIIAAGERGCAALFNYGAVVLFGITPIEEANFINNLQHLTIGFLDSPEVEYVEIQRRDTNSSKIENGVIYLSELNLKLLQIVADILAKSVVLDYYEVKTASVFDRIDPIAMSLQNTNWSRHQVRELLKQLGNTLSVQHKVVGRVEIMDKPEILWENPELERFYLLLEKEYEIQERLLVLERKLELISRTAETALGLLQHNTSMRVEWYIVILIVVEIFLSLYDLIFR